MIGCLITLMLGSCKGTSPSLILAGETRARITVRVGRRFIRGCKSLDLSRSSLLVMYFSNMDRRSHHYSWVKDKLSLFYHTSNPVWILGGSPYLKREYHPQRIICCGRSNLPYNTHTLSLKVEAKN